MKKHLRVLTSLLVVFTLVVSMFCIGADVAYARYDYGSCGGNVSWSFDTDSCVLTISGQGSMLDSTFVYDEDTEREYGNTPWKKYTNKIKKVIVEDGVTNVGAFSFIDCTKLESVVLPNTLLKIGKSAFAGTKLQYVNIPNSVQEIGDHAFYRCFTLKEVDMGSGIRSIGSSCFGFTGLETVNYNGSEDSWNQVVKLSSWNGGDPKGKIKYIFKNWSFDDTTGTLTVSGSGDMVDYAYYMDGTLTAPWGGIKNKIKTVILSETITSIGDYAFSHCKNLEKVQLPKNLKSIGDGAFDGCENLKSINLAEGLQEIGYAAFRTTGFKSVSIPDSVTVIGGYAFAGCINLSTIQFPKGIQKVNEAVFYGCKSITELKLPDTLKEIGKLAFSSIGISKLKIPASVTTLGESAFADCKYLEEVEVGIGVKTLGDYCFSNCKLKKVYYSGTKVQWNQISKSGTWNNGSGNDRMILNYMKNGVMTDYAHYDPNIINVIVDGNYINFDTKPQFVNGRTMVPMRRIFEELGASVQWDNATWTAIAKKDGIEIRFTIDDYTMYKNGSANALDVPAQLIDGRTLVPLRAVSEAFGCDVGWDGNDNVVSIISDRQNYTMLYTKDGRSRCYSKSEANGKSGWYNEPFILLYNCTGSEYFLQSEAEAQVKVGWSYTYINGHNWKAATCTAPKTCTRCGVTSGGKAAHSFNKKTGKCDYCSTSMNEVPGTISDR